MRLTGNLEFKFICTRGENHRFGINIPSYRWTNRLKHNRNWRFDWRLRAWGRIVQVFCGCVCTWCLTAGHWLTTRQKILPIFRWLVNDTVLSQYITGDTIRWLKGCLFACLFAMIIFQFSLAKIFLPHVFLFHFFSSIFALPDFLTRLRFCAFQNLMLSAKRSGDVIRTTIKDKNTPYKLLARLIRLIRDIAGHKSCSLISGIDWQAT